MASEKSKKRKAAHAQFSGKVRVAIIGGGCAGVTAAWHLAKLPEHYEVHVFERSHRLGGKGASGRDEQGHIIEHGLHVWMGFYENAFRMIRECYDEVQAMKWGPKAADPDGRLPHGSFEEAFVAEPHIGVSIRGCCDSAELWSGMFPPTAGTPGDPMDEASNPFTLSNYLWRCFMLLRALLQSVVAGPSSDSKGKPAKARTQGKGRSPLDEALEANLDFDPFKDPAPVIDALARYLRTGALVTAAGLKQAVTFLEQWAQRVNKGEGSAESALNLIEAVAAQTRKQLRDAVAIDPELRWKTEVIDIVLTIAVGLYRDRVLFSEKGLDAINHLDYKEWLRRHGADPQSVDSQFINGIYDLTFAYRNGDRNQPQLAAGVALRGALRMFFTYRGSMFWRMRSGMGDAVFAPLYKVLSKKGVKFHFGHSITGIDFKVGDDGLRYVDNIQFMAPAKEKAVALDALGCWRHEVQTDKAVKRVARSLANGADFDAVILAVGIEDLKPVLGKGMASLPDEHRDTLSPWRDAQEYLETVGTKAAQVWMPWSVEALGWQRGSAIVTGLDAEYQTWADMTHTIPSERKWREIHPDRASGAPEAVSVAYFCGVVKEHPAQEKRIAVSRESRLDEVLDLLKGGMVRDLWPAAFRDGKTAASLAVHHHVQWNTEGSDRYTLSLPGTIGYRISPLDTTFANMTVAGDWTACGLDAGCVESAVMSGMLAAHAITNVEPPLESIVGYDHP